MKTKEKENENKSVSWTVYLLFLDDQINLK